MSNKVLLDEAISYLPDTEDRIRIASEVVERAERWDMSIKIVADIEIAKTFLNLINHE